MESYSEGPAAFHLKKENNMNNKLGGLGVLIKKNWGVQVLICKWAVRGKLGRGCCGPGGE